MGLPNNKITKNIYEIMLSIALYDNICLHSISNDVKIYELKISLIGFDAKQKYIKSGISFCFTISQIYINNTIFIILEQIPKKKRNIYNIINPKL
jgi:hypothetical protein